MTGVRQLHTVRPTKVFQSFTGLSLVFCLVQGISKLDFSNFFSNSNPCALNARLISSSWPRLIQSRSITFIFGNVDSRGPALALHARRSKIVISVVQDPIQHREVMNSSIRQSRIIRIVAVLPASFGPRNPVTWPGRTLKLSPSSATTEPKCFLSSSTGITIESRQRGIRLPPSEPRRRYQRRRNGLRGGSIRIPPERKGRCRKRTCGYRSGRRVP